MIASAVLLLAAACSTGDAAPPAATPTPSATAEPTPPRGDPSPAPTVTPTPTAAPTATATATPHGGGSGGYDTGVPEADAAIEAVLAGDVDALLAMIAMQRAECMDPNTQGLGGPPRCEPGEAVGTPVEAFALAGCEGSWARDPRPTLEQFIDGADRLHSVSRLPERDRNEPYWPMGEYLVLFEVDRDGMTYASGLYLEDGQVAVAWLGCGSTPEDALELIGVEEVIFEAEHDRD